MPEPISFTQGGYTNPNTLERQRLLAQQLRERGAAPIPTQQGVPIQWTQGLAKLLNAYSGGRATRGVEEAEARNIELGQQDLAQVTDLVTRGNINPRNVVGEAGLADDLDPGGEQLGTIPGYKTDFKTPGAESMYAQARLDEAQQNRLLTPEQEAQKLRLAQGSGGFGLTSNVFQKPEDGSYWERILNRDGTFIDRPFDGTPTRGMPYDPDRQGLITEAREEAKAAVFLNTAARVGEAEALQAFNIVVSQLEAKSQTEASTLLKDMESSLPVLKEMVESLRGLSKNATHTMVGRFRDVVFRELNLGVGPAGKARAKYLATVRNNILPLLRQTFGAQFTAAEGEQLFATLGDVNVSPTEKEAVLDAFITSKKNHILSLQRRTEGANVPGTIPPLGTGFYDEPDAQAPPPSGELSQSEQDELEQLRRELINER
jgi:hypothetical protein